MNNKSFFTGQIHGQQVMVAVDKSMLDAAHSIMKVRKSGGFNLEVTQYALNTTPLAPLELHYDAAQDLYTLQPKHRQLRLPQLSAEAAVVPALSS
ncbi:hypothetical protein [Deinococcus roseus]|uniref:Uncharacterized protein n=1 Tax=Deinococcus roseus TaxID=392414 RepID=A0ABQ2D3G5_9DEIO|nr:hypothetical protein [Deinococcus roseus]GGJ44447.1 hypothetical protein GCM10008938_33320 [Deinococcus roseus]